MPLLHCHPYYEIPARSRLMTGGLVRYKMMKNRQNLASLPVDGARAREAAGSPVADSDMFFPGVG
jgi:hypothetical protein